MVAAPPTQLVARLVSSPQFTITASLGGREGIVFISRSYGSFFAVTASMNYGYKIVWMIFNASSLSLAFIIYSVVARLQYKP